MVKVNPNYSYDSEEHVITIPFEEYKELLITKGRYEELKSQYIIPNLNPTRITYTDKDGTQSKFPYKVTCDTNSSNDIQISSGSFSTLINK